MSILEITGTFWLGSIIFMMYFCWRNRRRIIEMCQKEVEGNYLMEQSSWSNLLFWLLITMMLLFAPIMILDQFFKNGYIPLTLSPKEDDKDQE